MQHFIFRKLAYGVLVLFMVILLISSIIYLAPVDPARLTFGQRADVETVKEKTQLLGLDKPLYVQLGYYLRDLSPINFLNNEHPVLKNYSYVKVFSIAGRIFIFKKPYLRESFQQGRLVSTMLAEAIPRTLLLALIAITIALVIGILFGLIAALNKDGWIDQFIVSLSVLGISLPSYVTAILFALIFGYWLQSWTGLEIQGGLVGLDDYGEEKIFWKNLVLPALALGVRPIAIITQLTRAASLDVLGQSYIRTASAKGLSFGKVIKRHLMRNALNPVFTAASGWFASLLAGAFFVENVFGYNGLGLLTIQALLAYDIPVILGAVLFTAASFVILNILVDLIYGWIDPRVVPKV